MDWSVLFPLFQFPSECTKDLESDGQALDGWEHILKYCTIIFHVLKVTTDRVYCDGEMNDRREIEMEERKVLLLMAGFMP